MNGPEDGIRVEDAIAMAGGPIAITDVNPEKGTVTGTPINQFELRNYELAKLLRDGSWERVATYRPNELGRGQANAACRALNEAGRSTYQVRGVVSVELPKVEEPLVLEADNDGTGPSESDAGDATPVAEGDAAQSSAEAGGGLTGVYTDLGDSTPESLELGGEG